jgi:hypothetical protein
MSEGGFSATVLFVDDEPASAHASANPRRALSRAPKY